MKKKFLPPQKVRANTLLETMIAIVVLSLALAAGVQMLSSIIFQSEKNRDRILGTYLATECAELVRNLRDSLWRQRLDFGCPFPDFDQKYRISPTQKVPSAGSVVDCKTDLGVLVEQNPQNIRVQKYAGKYGHFPSEPTAKNTHFFRSITFDPAESNENKWHLKCSVTWSNRGNHSAQISTILTNWRQN